MAMDWTGKRLCIDLSNQRAWTEEISEGDLISCIGGRGLNAKFFLERISRSGPHTSWESAIAFAVGPLTGSLAPCSGWTSISSMSPLSDPRGYAHVSMPGHWGAQLKFAGFDQCVIQGKGEKPIYIWIDRGEVRFEDGRFLQGKDTTETMICIHEEKNDRNLEILCIGPAGERLISFSNVVNRFSWTGDHIGLGQLFGEKNLKAIAIRGNTPVTINDPDRFLTLCLALRNRIHRDRNAWRLKEDGTFYSLGENGGGLGIKNFNEVGHPGLEKKWKASYFENYFGGQEGCFSCPIHCGRVTQFDGTYFGGIHLEGAWSLGPRIGIFNWESTLRLYRICQHRGLDPSSVGSLLSWVMDCHEKGILSDKDLGSVTCHWGDAGSILQIIDQIMNGKGPGEIFRQGSLQAAKILEKGLDRVAHSCGMDLPVRDPRSSMIYALGLTLFPTEWDYLRSVPSLLPGLSDQKNAVQQVSSSEELKILSDLVCLCPLVVAHFSLISMDDIAQLITAARGTFQEPEELRKAVQKTIETERDLFKKTGRRENGFCSLPIRFFEDQLTNGFKLNKEELDRATGAYYENLIS